MMRVPKQAAGLAILVVVALGCKQAAPVVIEDRGSAGSSAAGPGSAGSGSASGSSGSSLMSLVSDTGGGTQTVSVRDPSLRNIPAFVFTIPAKWHFEGTLYQGGNCVQMPSAVTRATSPDGLSTVEALPPFGWVWGPGTKAASDCLPVDGPMSIDELLQRVAKMMHVEPGAVSPDSAKMNAKLQAEPRPAGMTQEFKGIFVRGQNGSFAMKGVLNAQVTCTVIPAGGHKCNAYVSELLAPEQRFDAVYREWNQPGLGGHGGDKVWFAAYIKRMNDQSQAFIAQSNAAFKQRYDQNAQQFAGLQARAQQFQADQQVRQQMHNDFLSTMQRGTDMSLARANQSMNARSTAASNIVDYALDRQTVMDPGTGQVSKVSSAYTTTWVDSTGKMSYQTNYSNANPNGEIPGTWVKQNVVNGNGTVPH